MNHDATIELARAAVDAGVRRFVHVSTSLVYGPGLDRPARGDDEPNPPQENAYASSKAAAETALIATTADTPLGLRILRLAFVYGEGDPHLRESLMWAKDWATTQRLHLVHHADVGQALIRALRTEGMSSYSMPRPSAYVSKF